MLLNPIARTHSNHFHEEVMDQEVDEDGDETFGESDFQPVTRPVEASSRGAAYQEQSDEELMALLSEGKQDALETLIKRHGPLVRRVIFGVLHNDGETEEVLMEVFLYTWKNASLYSNQKGKPLGWLITMARRRGIDRLRRRQSYSAARERFQIEVKHHQSSFKSDRDASKRMEQSDFQRFVLQKIEDLPPFQRDAINLCFFNGMSQRECASHTGIPLGTIKTRVELGLKKLGVSLRSARDY